jgi:hypothetical protein
MIGFAKSLLDLGKAWLGNRKAKADNEHKQEIKEIEAGVRDNDRWLRRGSFILFAWPMIWAYFDPQGVKTYFEITLNALPDWYIQMFLLIVGGIWSISSIKNILPGIIKAVRK